MNKKIELQTCDALRRSVESLIVAREFSVIQSTGDCDAAYFMLGHTL